MGPRASSRTDLLAQLVRDIKERSIYLLDRETYIESIFERIKQDIAFTPICVTGVSGTGYDFRGIFCGFPPEFLTGYVNKDHANMPLYKDHVAAAQKFGYATKIFNDVEKNYPVDYDELYKPFGFLCGFETVFCSESGVQTGIVGGIRADAPRSSDQEMLAISRISPYVFYSFLRYRWLLGTDFFTVSCFDAFPFGIITSDDEGKITFINETARRVIKGIDGSVPASLPMPLMEQIRRLKTVPRHDDTKPCLIFQEIEAYAPPYGMAICYRFDETHGGQYLPVKGSGWVSLIDSRKKDGDARAHLTRRELEVIRRLAQGLQDKEIAFELGIAERTVQTYIQSLFAKLNTQNRTEAAVKAIRLGLL